MIFISCGQFTNAEKRLGKQIAEMVRSLTGLEPFFAEEVQDLNGLDTNILGALHRCVAFITVLHPRGDISRPDKPALTRASVWIEQEIAIATYIQRVENRSLPIIAFRHAAVGREGIRELLHLNPIEFTDESEVLAALPERLKQWKTLATSGVSVRIESRKTMPQEGHPVRFLEVMLVNDSSQRIESYDCQVRLPSSILKHWSTIYPLEQDRITGASHRVFRLDEKHVGPVMPYSVKRLTAFDYCAVCAREDHGGVSAVVLAEIAYAKLWINGREYADAKTVAELAGDAASVER